MHRLVPALIIENLHKDILQGRLNCAALFVDISGFTKLTETLMRHGQYGAEVLAGVMRAIFTPTLRSVYEQGGFVVNFAGDAITAVFPMEQSGPQDAALRALAAARQIQASMADNDQTTRYGTFEFTAKVGLSAGEVDWGIILSPNKERAVYYFKGAAVEGCAKAELHAHAGDIIVDEAVWAMINKRVMARPVAGSWRVLSVLTTLPESQGISLPPPDVEQIKRFYPRILVEDEILGEFRQVINLFVNLEGAPGRAEITSFMEQVFSLQDKYGGLINRLDFGDKGCHLVLFWGAPTSYENDVTRALDFVLELRAKSQIPIRAGMTYRIAHAGFVGSPLAEEYTCYGSGVNLAARQMVSAGWDEIWIDGEIERRSEGRFVIESLGRKEYKGFGDPQPTYLLSGAREVIISPFAGRPLFGRQVELDRLQQALRPIFDGRFGGVVAVVGEAGIGKSHLVHALLEPFVTSGKAAVCFCQTDEIIHQSLGPFRYFLRHYFDQSTTRDEAGNKGGFEEILAELRASTADSSLTNELERISSFLGALVGLYWEGSLYDQLDPELRFENNLNALKTFFRAESRRQPVIVQLEDAHWLDDDSKGFLSRLTRNMAGFPLVLLMTSRGAVSPAYFAAGIPLEVVELQALGEEGLDQMAEAFLHDRPSPALLQVVRERTEGNPFYTEQLLHYLQDNNLQETAAGPADGVLPRDVYIPADVRVLLTSRLDRLPSPVKEVVQYAAVLGREFEAPILFEMMAQDPELAEKLATAVDQSIWTALDEVRYLFHHALLRDAAYDMQIHTRLRQLHKLAGQAFERQVARDPDLVPRYPEIAYHFDRAEERTRASHYYGKAADLAKDNYSNKEAISYFSRGLNLTDDAEFKIKYHYLCGRETIYGWLGQRDEQLDDLNELEELLAKHPDDLKQADLALRQSSFALVQGDYEKAVAAANVALSFAKRSRDAAAQAKAHHRHGRNLWQQGLAVEAEDYLTRALNLARAAQDSKIEAECLYDLGVVNRFRANYDKAKSFLHGAFAVYSKLEDERGIIQCQNLFGIIANESGNLLESQEHYLQALDVCRKVGLRYWETHILLNIGNSFFDLGDYASAGEYLDQALKLSDEIGDLSAKAMSLDTLGLVWQYQDKFKMAIACFKQALAINESTGNQRDKGFVLTHLGYAQLDNGQLSEAKSSLELGLAIRHELQSWALAIDSEAGLALIALETGKNSEALAYVEEILSYIESHGTDGIEQPVLVYLSCYRVLAAVKSEDPTSAGQVGFVLQEGYKLLEARQALIKDEEMKKRFIEQVPFNRELLKAWETLR